MEESELEREDELLDGSVEGRPMSEKGVPEKMEFEFPPEKKFNQLMLAFVNPDVGIISSTKIS